MTEFDAAGVAPQPLVLCGTDDELLEPSAEQLRELRSAIADGRRVSVERVRFTDPLDLRHARAPEFVEFVACVFDELVDATNARFELGLTFERCEFHASVRLAGAWIGGALSLEGSRLELHPDLAQVFGTMERALLTAMRTDPRPRAAGTPAEPAPWDETLKRTSHSIAKQSAENPALPLKHDLVGVRVEGRFLLSGVNVFGTLDLTNAECGDDVIAKGVQLRCTFPRDLPSVPERCPVGVALLFESGVVRHQLYLGGTYHPRAAQDVTRTFVSLGTLDLRVEIGGSLELRGGWLSVRGIDRGDALLLSGAIIKRSLFLRDNDEGLHCRGKLDLRAKVDVNVELSGVDVSVLGVPRARGTAITLATATVGGQTILSRGRGALACRGKIDLRAKLAGGLSVVGVQVSVGGLDCGGIAIDLETAEVGGSGVFFVEGEERVRCTGQIDMRCKVLGSVTLRGIDVSVAEVAAAAHGRALNLEGAEIGGDLSLKDSRHGRFTAVGQVALQASVGGSVLLSGVNVSAVGVPKARGVAITFDGADVAGSVTLEPGAERPRVRGKVVLKARVGRNIDLVGIDVSLAGLRHREDDWVLSLHGAAITDELRLRPAGEQRCRVEGGIRASGITCKAVLVSGLDHVGTGWVDFSYLCSSGWAAFSESTLTGILDLHQSKIGGDLGLRGKTLVLQGGLSLRYAMVAGDLTLDEACLGASEDEAHVPDTPGHDPIRDRDVDAAIRARGIHLSGRLVARRVRPFLGGDGEPCWGRWDFESARIEGNAVLTMSQIHGSLVLEDARIVGELNLTETRVEGHLVMRSARVEGRVFADESTSKGPFPSVVGDADLRGAHLRQVHIRMEQGAPAAARGAGAPSARPIPRELLLQGVETEDLFLSGIIPERRARSRAAHGFEPKIHVAGLSFERLQLGPDFAVAGQAPGWWRLSTGDSIRLGVWAGLFAVALLLLYDGPAQVTFAALCVYGCLMLAVTVRQFIAPKVQASGRFGWLVVGLERLGLVTMAERLRSRGEQGQILDLLDRTEFDRGFYIAVEQFFRRRGREVIAAEVFLCRRKRETRVSRHLSWFTLAWRWFLDVAVGYGSRVARPVHLFLLLFFVNVGAFSDPQSVERPLTFVQVQEVAPADADLAVTPPPGNGGHRNPWPADGSVPDVVVDADGNRASTWTENHAVFMAMRVMIPLTQLVAESDWEPSSRVFSVVSYENFASVSMVLAMILIPTIVAGAGGFLMRNR